MMVGHELAAEERHGRRRRGAVRLAGAATSRAWATAAPEAVRALSSTSAPARSSGSPASRATGSGSWREAIAGLRKPSGGSIILEQD